MTGEYNIKTETSTISLDLAKVCWLVHKNDLKNLKKIIKTNFSYWGGINFIIIPIFNSDVDILFKHFLNIYDPDFIISFDNIDTNLKNKLDKLINPIQIFEKFKKHDEFNFLRDIYPRLDASKKIEKIRLYEKSNFSDGFKKFFDIVYPLKEIQEILKDLKIETSKNYDDTLDFMLKNKLNMLFSPLARTGSFWTFKSQFKSEAVNQIKSKLSKNSKEKDKRIIEIMLNFILGDSLNIILGDSNSVEDLCVYWNLKIFDPGMVVWFPKEEVNNNEFIDLLLKNTITLKGEKSWGDLQNINIFSYTSSEKLINDLKKNFQRTCKTIIGNRFSIIINEPETISYNGIKFTLKDYMYDVLFNEGKGHVIPSYPDFLGQIFTGNSLITNIDIQSYPVPRLKELLPLICPERDTIDGQNRTRLASTGIRRIFDQNLIQLKEPDNFEIVKAVFKDKELDIALSDKGHIANRVISLLGGLEKCDILIDNEVIKLIRGMIDKQGTPVIKSLNEVKAFFKKDKEKNLEKLLKFKILFRGYNIKCKDCATDNWLSINDVKETISCSGCLNEISLPIHSEVIYKLNSLVIHSFNQGALTHINNIVKIRKANNFKFYVLGLKIHSLNRELDMVLITDDGIIIGECKNNAGELKTQEYDGIMHIGELIKAKKVVFGSLFNKFSKAIKLKNDSEVIFIEESVSDKDLSGVMVKITAERI